MKGVTVTRTDIHAPSSKFFDPQAYRCAGVFDNHSVWGNADQRKIAVSTLVDQGFRFGHGSSSQCGHCGARIRYAALMVREDAKEFIFVGEDCLDNRFSGLTKDEFQRLRKAAKLNRERERISVRRDALIADHPHLARLDEFPDNTFLTDLKWKLNRSGELSIKQIDAAARSIQREEERAAKTAEREKVKAALVAQGVSAPEGKALVKGEVVSLKYQDGIYGSQWKIVVKHDEGWSAWATLPASLTSAIVDDNYKLIPGVRIQFYATLKKSDRDPLFAFASRPTQPKLLTL